MSKGMKPSELIERIEIYSKSKIGDYDEGLPRPNELSIHLSKSILDILIDMERCPGDMIPHLDGGVSIMFFRDLDWMYIETYNDGDVVISDLAKKEVVVELKHPVMGEDLKIIEELVNG